MRSNDLIDIIGEAADEHICDAKSHKKSKMPRWAKWSSAIAACLCLVVGGVFVSQFIFDGARQGNGGDSDLNYMYYPGPVFPLTIQGDADGIAAQRNVNFDFSPYLTRIVSYDNGEKSYEDHDTMSIVTDSYTLTNESGSDQALTLLYPFAGDLQQWETYPTIAVDGSTVRTTLHPGPYSGGFEGVWGSDNPEMASVNLAPVRSFDQYVELLSDGSYMASAFDSYPELNQPVTVYRLHDFIYSATTEDVNPSLCMEFYIDYDKTTVFSYNMNGMSYDIESGYHAREKGSIEYKPNVDIERQHPTDGYVILVGEDLESYAIQGYRDMGCEEGEELDDLGCTVTRYETTLGEIVRVLMEDQMGERIRLLESYKSGTVDTANMPVLDMYCGLAAELLTTYGLLSDEPVDRYKNGMLDDTFSSVYVDGRIIYMSFEVTIPAGGSVNVEVTQQKDGSMDYVGKDKGKEGYDMATQLGSVLSFSEQTASISGYDEIEIVAQNFGFDLLGGITDVTLDLSQPHYWMEIRKIKTD